jgi:hypothetical protein
LKIYFNLAFVRHNQESEEIKKDEKNQSKTDEN